jgi:hypothetical protein
MLEIRKTHYLLTGIFMAKLMIVEGATSFNIGLNAACSRGHFALAEKMIEMGAD